MPCSSYFRDSNDMEEYFMNRNTGRLMKIILGPALFAICLLLLPETLFNFNARAAIGLICWMGAWWVTLPVGPAVTAFLPIVVTALFNIAPLSGVISSYFSEIVILLLGADLIDKRIALKALCLIGPSIKQQIAVWFLLPAVLSTVLPNAVVCAVLIPIAVSMLRYIGDQEISKSAAGPIILASIAWGAGIGGLGSPLGGAMNLVAVNYFEEFTGKEFLYIDWLVRLLPVLVIILLCNLAYLFLIRPKIKSLNGTKEYFSSLYKELPKFNRDETISLILFALPTLLAFLRPLFDDFLPGMKPAYIFLLFGIISFVISKKDGEMLLTWNRAEKGIIWGLLMLFAGGQALGGLINDTGASKAIADIVCSFRLTGGFFTILIFVAFTVLLSEISSNTAAAAIAVPIVVSVTTGLGLNPIPYVFITAAAFNCAYVLPTSIRAIPIGYGLSPKYLFKNGLVLTLIGIIVISILGYLMITFWPGFSTL